MAVPEAEQAPRGLVASAKQVADHARALARLELELAQLELQRKGKLVGIGTGLGLGAAVVAVFAVGFLFATIAAGLATVMPWWAALLIVTVALLIVVAVLGALAARTFKRLGPPVPEQAIAEARETTEALKQ